MREERYDVERDRSAGEDGIYFMMSGNNLPETTPWFRRALCEEPDGFIVP